MERNCKYFIFGFASSVCGAVSLGSLTWIIYTIINLHKDSGWWVVLDLALILFNALCFWTINWLLGKMIYYGQHLNNKIYDKASNQELFEVIKQEKFYWNCICEEKKDEENPERISESQENRELKK